MPEDDYHVSACKHCLREIGAYPMRFWRHTEDYEVYCNWPDRWPIAQPITGHKNGLSNVIHVVVCAVCPDPKTRRPPRRWKETCPECASSIAVSHHAGTGHRVEQHCEREATPAEVLRDSRTVRVAGKATGW